MNYNYIHLPHTIQGIVRESLSTIPERSEEELYAIIETSPISPEDPVVDVPTIPLAPISNPEEDVVITPGTYEVTEKMVLTAKSVTLRNSELSGNQGISVTSPGVSFDDVTLSGTWDKTGKTTGVKSGNSMVSMSDSNRVIIKDLKVTKTDGYNCIEIGLDKKGTTTYVEVSGAEFTSPLSNNALSVFSLADGAEVYIHDSHFSGGISNLLRFSNTTGAKGIKVRIENVTVDTWDTTPEYAGLILFQDYPKGHPEYFGPEYFQISLRNVVGPWGKIDSTDIFPTSDKGREDGHQVIYVYASGAVKAYDETMYPGLTVE